MRVFLTGATGFIGSAIVPELLQAGHQVLGLTRSDSGAEQLRAAGAEVHHGSLEDPATLRAGAARADGVIHCAFDHDFTNFMASCEKDRRAIEAIGDALAGSGRPLVITSGTGMGSPGDGQIATEDIFDPNNPNPRKISEMTGQAVQQLGVNVCVVRLPQVHDTVKQGLITYLVAIAREKGVSAYVGEGTSRLSAAHVQDVARLYRLALERAQTGIAPGARYNAVAEEGVAIKQIAEVIARGLNVPARSISAEEATKHFGWMSMFANLDLQASSAKTRQVLDWQPSGPTLIADLEAMNYN